MHDEKIAYMKIAANLCSFGFDKKQIDLLVSLYDAVLDKKGNLSVDDICHIEYEVKKRNDIISRKELLDRVSEKE